MHTKIAAAMINIKAATMELAASNLRKNYDNETTHAPSAQHGEFCQQKHKYNWFANDYCLTFLH